MTASVELPLLPWPERPRWQPLRLGLVEIYHYDCEEFWFRDGHLLLRGNNGTGKSKVLSLTLPFLLDANLSATRVEPDGDRSKRMEWNLLMGGRHERRTGYVWIEFGRCDDAGNPQTLTLGCGLSAVEGRQRVEAWHFLTDQRIGRDLWLMTPERVVLGRERLTERLSGHGQMFGTAQEYRRAVDERLFRLGDERYRALMDTLIQLRQPQLSKQPDERRLSDALTGALPPLPQAALNDVAEAMTQLDLYRHELEEIDALRGAVAQFDRRYRVYARVQSRRQARGLRQAQTEFDNASRGLNEARAALEQAQAEFAACAARHDATDRQLARDRAALDELRRDPVMRDAQRLHEAERQAEEHASDAARCAERSREAGQRRQKEASLAENRRQETAQAASRLVTAESGALERAAALGLAAEHSRLYSPSGADFPEAALRSALARRRDHLAQVRRRLHALGQAAGTRNTAAEARNLYAASLDSAQIRAREADAQQRRAADLLVHEWQGFLGHLIALTIPGIDAALDELAEWVDSLGGDNPVRLALARAQQEALHRLAEQEATLKHRETMLREEDGKLAEEEARLAQGEDRMPPTSHTRAPEARRGRAGAPLWQLIDFAGAVEDSARAGLEAALEAAGLLDAWVTPEGALLAPDTHDVILVPRAKLAPSLAEWLVPAQSPIVSPVTVSEILGAIACTHEEPAGAETWISPDGRFRIGPARGAWTKPAAQYIGYSARDTARRRRLDEIAGERQVLGMQLAAIQVELHALGERRDRLNEECGRAPTDDPLRDAHARFSAAEFQRREAQERLAEAEARLNETEQVWSRAQAALLQDAGDLGLPADAEALVEFEGGLGTYGESVGSLGQAVREHRRSLHEQTEQERREQEAAAEAMRWREDHDRRARTAEDAAARRDLLRETIGAAVTELQERLTLTDKAVADGEQRLREAEEGHRKTGEQRARCEQRTEDAAGTLAERQERRQNEVARLQAFAGTGLIEVALPEGDVAKPTAWTVDPALQLARRIEQALSNVRAEEADWTRIQAEVSRDFTQLVQAMSARNHQALAEQTDYGLIVQIVHQNRPERPDVLERRLAAESAQRREILTAREREVLENHLQAEVAASLQKLLQDAERRLQSINGELGRRATSTGVRFRLEWQPLPEGEDGAPVGLAAARARLLNRSPEAWSADDRRLVGEFLQNRIHGERTREDGGSLVEHLSRALDYRQWHRFRVRRFQDGSWRPLSGPASSGERALGLTVPLFAAASSHYASTDYPHAPRLVLLDEAFAGIDDEARADCMALIREFDLDFVMTSEREWGCYAELPGLAISHLVRRDGVDAVYVSRWSWDGRARREEPDPSRRFPETATTPA
jgi:uncharacterized protein (TIGR02680 family)